MNASESSFAISPTATVLLGAGASVGAGVPASHDMTQALVEGVQQAGGWNRNRSQALNFICGALVSYDAAQGANPYAGLDVERVFAAVQLLAERRTLEVSPFVSAWHAAVDAWDRPELPSFFDKHLQKELLGSSFNGARDMIVNLIKTTAGPGTGKVYEELAAVMISQLHTLVAIDESSVGYLRPLVEACARDSDGLTVATLNYDRSVELAATAAGIELSTGIETWSAERAWRWGSADLRLLKLHGSIDWQWVADEEPGRLPSRTVYQSGDDDSRGEPVIIFGQRSKLQAEGPFLSLLAEWERQLAESDQLVAIGYSFRDEHINQIITHWINEESERSIVAVDPAWPEHFGVRTHDFRQTLEWHLTTGSRAGPPDRDRLTVMRQPAEDAMAELFRPAQGKVA